MLVFAFALLDGPKQACGRSTASPLHSCLYFAMQLADGCSVVWFSHTRLKAHSGVRQIMALFLRSAM